MLKHQFGGEQVMLMSGRGRSRGSRGRTGKQKNRSFTFKTADGRDISVRGKGRRIAMARAAIKAGVSFQEISDNNQGPHGWNARRW